MRISRWIPALGLLVAAVALPIVYAQGPGGFGGGRSLSKAVDVDELVTKMMAFDADKDGKLTKAEVTDTRLLGLFARADADKDGIVTKGELTALGEKEYTAGGGGFGGGPGGPGGPPGGFGPGGPGRPGELMPPMLQQILGLSSDQKSEMAALQKEVDAKIEKILNDQQKAQLKQMRERGPGGPGGPGGRGRGGPGGLGGPNE